MNAKLLRKIALVLVIMMTLTCFAGCKSNESDSGLSGVVDTNGVAGSEIEIEIPEGGSQNDDDDQSNGQTNNDQTNDDQTNDDQTNDDQTNDDQTNDDQTNDNQTNDDQSNDDQTNDDQNNEDLFDDEKSEVEKPAYDPAKELVVVSYNIKCAWYSKTFDQVVDQIKAVDADIVGFQEVDYKSNRSGNTIDQIATIAGKAGFPYFYFEPVIELGNGHEKYTGELKPNLYGHAVMSKYPIKKSEIVWPDAQNPNEGAEVRNFGRHEIDVDGTTVVLYNGHLDGSEGRNQYFQLQEEWMSKDEYAICVGDFNETYSEFQAYFDYDKYYSFAFGEDGESVVLRGQEGKEGTQVIDHIIVTKDKFVWKNGGKRDNGYYVTPHAGASDHDMVYCYLNIIK